MKLTKEEEFLRKIGEKLTKLRKSMVGNPSYETFAYDHDIPRMQYWRLENGKANFTIRTLLKILSIHNLSLRDFFKEIDEPIDMD
jgi:hypothetical protein